MSDRAPPNGLVAFALVYFTFFLDNVLLTVLVPIIPDWVRGSTLAPWARRGLDEPLGEPLNDTVRHGPGRWALLERLPARGSPGAAAVGRAALWAGAAGAGAGAGGAPTTLGLVLGAKAGAQLAAAPLAAGAVSRRGAAPVLAAATALLAAAALGLAACGAAGAGAACAGAARAAQGAGAAGAGVAGLALAAQAAPAHRRKRALAALLGAVALGVLVGYPFGGVASALWSRPTPFLLIAIALLVDLAMQSIFLDREEFRQTLPSGTGHWAMEGLKGVRQAMRGAGGACAGAVLLTTTVMAALEPCLPLWLADTYHPQRWAAGAVFVPDSAGYLAATCLAGGAARRLGAERVALAAQAALGLAALALPLAPTVWWLSVPHAVLGLGLGATDAALLPALAATAGRSVPHVAALLQAAASVAYTLGPVVGGLLTWAAGFPATMRVLGALNLLYTLVLYRTLRAHPLSVQWGASSSDDEDDEEEIPLAPGEYVTLQ